MRKLSKKIKIKKTTPDQVFHQNQPFISTFFRFESAIWDILDEMEAIVYIIGAKNRPNSWKIHWKISSGVSLSYGMIAVKRNTLHISFFFYFQRENTHIGADYRIYTRIRPRALGVGGIDSAPYTQRCSGQVLRPSQRQSTCFGVRLSVWRMRIRNIRNTRSTRYQLDSM